MQNQDEKKLIGYSVEPVYEAPKGSLQTAACMHCMVTGKMLDGMGGGGYFISPEVFNALRNYQLVTLGASAFVMEN